MKKVTKWMALSWPKCTRENPKYAAISDVIKNTGRLVSEGNARGRFKQGVFLAKKNCQRTAHSNHPDHGMQSHTGSVGGEGFCCGCWSVLPKKMWLVLLTLVLHIVRIRMGYPSRPTGVTSHKSKNKRSETVGY